MTHDQMGGVSCNTEFERRRREDYQEFNELRREQRLDEIEFGRYLAYRELNASRSRHGFRSLSFEEFNGPSIKGDRSPVRHVRFGHAMDEALRLESERTGAPASEVIRRALKAYLD